MKFNYIYILISCLFILLHQNTVGSVIAESEKQEQNLKAPELLYPTKDILRTSTPTFKWRHIPAKAVEYRFLIITDEGQIIVHNWVGKDTSFTITNPYLLDDLRIYYWSVTVYQGDHSVKSDLIPFCIDLNLSTDLEILNVELAETKSNWQAGDEVEIEVKVINSGTISCKNSKLLLCNGNINPNYFKRNAFRKSIFQDSLIIPQLDPSKMNNFTLTGRLKPGFNHFYALLQGETDIFDLNPNNNRKSGPVIQTNPNILKLKGLFVIYPQYYHVDKGFINLEESQIQQLYENIIDVKSYFWEHTRTLDFQIDTVHIDRVLTDYDFTYIDDKWGLAFTPERIKDDISARYIDLTGYDFVYMNYAWNNSLKSWTGFHGYAFSNRNESSMDIPFAAQPVSKGASKIFEISVHELLHVLEYYVKDMNKKFYSPDNKERITTFWKSMDYYDWILESWPSEWWFHSKLGRKVVSTKVVRETRWIPKQLSLTQNFPNPFNSSTTISYELPGETTQRVSLKIFSLLGVSVSNLVEEEQEPGVYSVIWNGTDHDGRHVSSGIYFYRLLVGERTIVKKLLYIK